MIVGLVDMAVAVVVAAQQEVVGVARDTAAAVAQQVTAVPCYLGDPGHIASRSSLVAFAILAAAGVAVVLRFPLCLLYRYPLVAFKNLFFLAVFAFSVRKKRVMILSVKHTIIGAFWLVFACRSTCIQLHEHARLMCVYFIYIYSKPYMVATATAPAYRTLPARRRGLAHHQRKRTTAPAKRGRENLWWVFLGHRH